MSDRKDAPSSFASEATMFAELAPEGVVASGASDLFAGRYQLLRELGRGGMGVVYRALDTMVGDLVALKTLEISGGAPESAVERFRREVRLARKITHPNVARTHDLGDAGGRHYLTMELVEGIDLATLLVREKQLPTTRAAAVAWMVCEGLAAAHAAGVVHRDLKPANILIEASGRVVLTDFGIARAFADDTSAKTVGTVGTLVYMAPEQVTGESSDPRTDLYAVGLLLYEMLTGELAFTGETPLAAAIARLSAPPPDLRARLPEAPVELAELVLRCLARSPEERPASAHEVAALLLAWLESVGKTPEQCAAMVLTSLASTAATGALLQSMTRAPTATPTATPPTTSTGYTRSTSNLTRRTPSDTMGRVGVLPLRMQGGRDFEYLGEGLAESIVDLLGRTHGVEVASSSSAARFRDDRDPAVVGEALGVIYVVDGTLQVAGTQARATIRLIDVASGTQLWSGRFSGSLADPFEFQDHLAMQIGEDLRRELILASYREHADADAIELCRQVGSRTTFSVGAIFDAHVTELGRVLAAHPTFTPVIPRLALLNLRGWFTRADSSTSDWETRAREGVSLAIRQASDFAETRLAQAILAVQDGRFREAVIALRQALAAAPAYPAALQYLGNLQCEAGQAEDGIRRLRLALALDPTESPGLFELARCSALRGDMDVFRETLKELRVLMSNRGPVHLLEMRVAAWNGDRATIERVLETVTEEPGLIMQSIIGYGRAALGLAPAPMEAVDGLLGRAINPRFKSMICQIAAEELCLVGEPERALTYFLRAADALLIDLEWTDRCPLLAEMRGLPGFSEGRRKVRERVDDLWGA